jgi:hypothetical protein
MLMALSSIELKAFILISSGCHWAGVGLEVPTIGGNKVENTTNTEPV